MFNNCVGFQKFFKFYFLFEYYSNVKYTIWTYAKLILDSYAGQFSVRLIDTDKTNNMYNSDRHSLSNKKNLIKYKIQ